MLFLLWSLVLGPGLLVNVILKDHWGTAASEHDLAFRRRQPVRPGLGDQRLLQPQLSFVSGEASTAAWLVGLAVLLPRRWRPAGVAVTGVYAALIGANRIAFGGHFLSDVLLSFGLTFLVMALLYRLFVERPPAALADTVLETKLTGIGMWLRRRERSSPGKR